MINVVKASGEVESFSEENVIGSLIRAGSDRKLAEKIVSEIKPSLYQNIPTFEIYTAVMRALKREQRSLADRYDLKRAIMELGPTGYPFEKFIASVLGECGYKTLTNQIILGKCVSHEVDIVATNSRKYLIECKFHNQPGYRTDIKVALYTYARFLDVKEKGFEVPWLVTNTKLTEDVKVYANCVGMKLTSWDYPGEESLRRLIDQSGLHPVTALTSISKKQKESLIERGIVFCRDLPTGKRLCGTSTF